MSEYAKVSGLHEVGDMEVDCSGDTGRKKVLSSLL